MSGSESETRHSDPPYGVAPSGQRLPAATRLGPVRLQVANLERSLGFYQGLIGLVVRERSEGAAVLGSPAGGLPLVELRERRGATPVPRTGRLGLYHFALLLPERGALGALLRRLDRDGLRPGMADHGVSEALYLTDPDGLGLEVYVDRPRSTWTHEGRQLRMVSDPLAVHELLAVADRGWEGPPSGTVVGHIHLFVSDLDAASAFYHDGLGLDRVVWSYPGALFLSAGGYHHHLGVNAWAARAPLPRETDAQLLEWTLVVPRMRDAEAAARGLEAAGAEVERGEGGGVVAADPWGTRLRMQAEPGA